MLVCRTIIRTPGKQCAFWTDEWGFCI